MSFSIKIKNELAKQNKTVSWLAEKLNLSVPYVYKLLDPKTEKRWNEDSINKACDVLGLKIEIK